jgi:hypothetical protein
MPSKRTTALMQIMQIDKKMTQISRSKRYQKIQQYTKLLKTMGGRAVVRVENPDNMGKLEDVRRNSPQAKKYLKSYELLLNEYDVLFDELGKRKDRLKHELF